jgi:hypothetical protein
MEHRWGQRFAVDLPIRMNVPLLGETHSRLTNLSLSGAFITTQMNVRVLSRLQVFIEIPGDALQDMASIAAFVARKSDHGIGVEWCEFAPAVVAKLLRDASLCRVQPDRRQVPRGTQGNAAAMPAAQPARRLKHGS